MKYEMCITIKPTLYQFKPYKQFEMTQDLLFEIFAQFKATIIAELTQEHNVHYHIMVELKDLIHKDLLLNRFRPYTKIFGRKSCTQVMFEDSYRAYIKKCYDETALILKRCPMVRDSFGVLSIQQFQSTNSLVHHQGSDPQDIPVAIENKSNNEICDQDTDLQSCILPLFR